MTKEARSGLPWDLLCADGLVVMVVEEKAGGVERVCLSKDLKANAGKTKLSVGEGSVRV